MTELKRTLLEDVFYPVHDPRRASPEYHRTHHHLVVEMDEPCWICGIRNSDVQNIADLKLRRKWEIETHHSEMEWAAERAFEDNGEMLKKVTADHAEILDDPVRLREWLDSEGNMLILCATDHRGARTGVHSISYPAWKLQKYQVSGGFQFIQRQELSREAAA